MEADLLQKHSGFKIFLNHISGVKATIKIQDYYIVNRII